VGACCWFGRPDAVAATAAAAAAAPCVDAFRERANCVGQEGGARVSMSGWSACREKMRGGFGYSKQSKQVDRNNNW